MGTDATTPPRPVDTGPRLYGLLTLRLFLGAAWLQTGWNKLATDGGWTASLEESVTTMVERGFGFYVPFLESVVLDSPELFAFLVTWGELGVGLSLFLGLGTRVGAAVGMFLSLNYALGQGRALWLPGLDPAFFWGQFALLTTAAGRHWGIDSVMRDRWPNWPRTIG